MEYRKLGKSGFIVSWLCFGALTIGPLQADLPVEKGGALIRRALEGGVNFIDTAELYNTYHHIRYALENYPGRVVIATKTYVYTREDAARSLEKALREMKRERIEIFLLHEQESGLTIEGHRPALNYLHEARNRGLVGAVGISCHTVEAVRAALDFEEIQVIHPIFNMEGMGIKDGSREEMLDAIKTAAGRGIGIYTMKPLGGGNLQEKAGEAFTYLQNQDSVDSVAVGMKSEAEVDYALYTFSGESVPAEVSEKLKKQRRRLLFMDEGCEKCMRCVESCPQDALCWEERPVADEKRCLWCGYCGAACPSFCLRII